MKALSQNWLPHGAAHSAEMDLSAASALRTVPTAAKDLPIFPLDMGWTLDQTAGHACGAGRCEPELSATALAEQALALWNAYVTTGIETYRAKFVMLADSLVAQALPLGDGACGWPVPLPYRKDPTRRRSLSARTQGLMLSVFVRALRLEGLPVYLETMQQAARAFARDVLDYGVAAPVGDAGLFFEDTCEYPASHCLAGTAVGLLGLHDYVAESGDATLAAVMLQAHETLHDLSDAFDAGYWTFADLLHRRIASASEHAFHVEVLSALAQSFVCDRCAKLSSRWRAYQRRSLCRLRHAATLCGFAVRSHAVALLRKPLLGARRSARERAPQLVCVPIPSFPVAGGTRGVLAGIARAMADDWEIEYLTHYVGPHTDGLTIHRFGPPTWHPWQFPNLWLYVLSGGSRLFSLMRQGRRYGLILPQDGVFTAAFAGIVGKLLGVRVVCMDHGNVTLPHSDAFHKERLNLLAGRPRFPRLLSRARYMAYWPSLALLAHLGAALADHFLPAGDDVATAHVQHYRVHPSRITQFPFLIDIEQFTPLDDMTRAEHRLQMGLAPDAVVIAMINRLAVEKGLSTAVEALHMMMQALAPDLRARVRVAIAGDGPLRAQLQADLASHNMEDICLVLGEQTPQEVARLLGISDIFLYAGTRGTNPVAVLEAMAAACCVVATLAPALVGRYLDNGRGLAIPVGDVVAMKEALVEAVSDLPEGRVKGARAREYVARRFTAHALRRALLRATFWTPRLPDRRSMPTLQSASKSVTGSTPTGNRPWGSPQH
jgi:glycosyltransferase involved in cell wall biosynthesis